MSSYDKAYQIRCQEGMRIQAEQNIRHKNNLSAWDALPYKKVQTEYSKLLKIKINKDKCKKSRGHA
jgi:hypothetical protein